MFTGIITNKGELISITGSSKANQSIYFGIQTGTQFLQDVKIGDSISCNGVCLTVIKLDSQSFEVELIPETIDVTSFCDAKVGSSINLEKAMQLGQRLDGHIVQGHVDGKGIVDHIIIDDDSWKLGISIPNSISKYIAYKGSVCINGVSLTVSSKVDNIFEVSLIKHTANFTNLGQLIIGGVVNIEVDVIARYLETLMASQSSVIYQKP